MFNLILQILLLSSFLGMGFSWMKNSPSSRCTTTLHAASIGPPSTTNKLPLNSFLSLPRALNLDNMSFGNRIELNIRLPTRESALATSFISNPASILETTWDGKKREKLNKNMYLLKFREFPLPGVDTISPEIEVVLNFHDGKLMMSSRDWKIKSKTGALLKDSRFMKKFDINLEGELSIEQAAPNASYVIARGWAEYKVQGTKPTVFRMAPSFVLDATIRLIQDHVQDYAKKEFASRFSKGFREYMLNSIE